MIFDNETAETCKSCGKKFTWELHGTGYPRGKDREDIICPYCGAKNGSVVTEGWPVSRKLEDE